MSRDGKRAKRSTACAFHSKHSCIFDLRPRFWSGNNSIVLSGTVFRDDTLPDYRWMSEETEAAAECRMGMRECGILVAYWPHMMHGSDFLLLLSSSSRRLFCKFYKRPDCPTAAGSCFTACSIGRDDKVGKQEDKTLFSLSYPGKSARDLGFI